MKITTVLFDLDGTLLPMDMEAFTKYYFGLLCKKMIPRGYDVERLVKGLWIGVDAMARNDGSRTNEEAFWEAFTEVYGEDVSEDMPLFNEFYSKEFEAAVVATSPTPEAAAVVKLLRDNGIRVALATNPIFPETATRARIRWAGFAPEDFEKFTAYETDIYAKPNPQYFLHFIEELGVTPEECLMVGNDAIEDLAAEQVGMKVFLLTDCILHHEGVDLTNIPQGGFPELREYICENVIG